MATDTEKKPSFDVYTGMLLGAALFLLVGSILMSMELNRYGGLVSGYPWWKTPAAASGS